MQYLGGKFRLSKQLSKYINDISCEAYWEPFCGSCWVTVRVEHVEKYASDANNYLVSMWQALQAGWIPPSSISEDEYVNIKNNKDDYPPELVSFVGFGCSFGGKWFGGYARSSRNTEDYALTAQRSLLKKLDKLQDVTFSVYNFNDTVHNIYDYLIYCDPPYQSTTQYDYIKNFNHELFWEQCRIYSKKNIVLISEYTAPDDFVALASFETRTDLRNSNNEMIPRVDKLFVHESRKEL